MYYLNLISGIMVGMLSSSAVGCLFKSWSGQTLYIQTIYLVFVTSQLKICQWLAAGRWFSLGTTVSSTNKTDPHDIKEILLKVTLNTITLLHITNEVCIFTNVLLRVYHIIYHQYIIIISQFMSKSAQPLMCSNNIFVSVIPLLTVNYRCYFVYNRVWYWRTFKYMTKCVSLNIMYLPIK